MPHRTKINRCCQKLELTGPFRILVLGLADCVACKSRNSGTCSSEGCSSGQQRHIVPVESQAGRQKALMQALAEGLEGPGSVAGIVPGWRRGPAAADSGKCLRRREKDTLKIVQAMCRGISSGADTPFELRALEALLAETVRQFERHHKRLLLLSDSVEREIMVVLKTSSGDLTRLLPIQKWVPHLGPPLPRMRRLATRLSAQHLGRPALSRERVSNCNLSGACRRLTEMRQDVAETRDAVKEVFDSDKLLAGLCLSERAVGPSPGAPDAPTEGMREAALLLESYERQISTVEGALKVRWPPSCSATSRQG